MTQEVLKLALECAERCEAIDGMYSWSATITAIKEALTQTQEPPPWWPAVENILNEYGLQAIDFVADFKNALAQRTEQEPVAKNEEGRITWLIDNWPQNCLLYTNAPQLKESEQKPYGYLWYTHYMEKRFTHYKPNEDQLSQCIGEVTPVYIRARGEQA